MNRTFQNLVFTIITFTSLPLFQETNAFPISITLQFRSQLRENHSRNPFFQIQSKQNDNFNAQPATQKFLLSRKQEKKLLKITHEYQRLNELKTELHLRTPESTKLNSFQSKELFLRKSGYESFEQLQQILDDGRIARETLITSNMGLVHRITQQILSSSSKKLQTLTYEDLIQEGSIGLSRAIDKYSPSHNTKFATYAHYWIRASILRALAEKNEYIRIPEHISNTVSKISKAVAAIGPFPEEDLVRTWAWKEVEEAKKLAESVGEKLDKVDRAMEVEKRRREGMVVLMGNEQRGYMRSDEENIARPMEENRKEELIKTLKNHLKPKEAEALCLRYGLTEADDGFRDYEAEAEADIFGPSGILASDEPTIKNQIVQATRLKKNEKQLKSAVSVKNEFEPTKGKWGEAMTFKEVGKQMGKSTEYGRRLCAVGLEKLRAAVDEGKLDPGLLY